MTELEKAIAIISAASGADTTAVAERLQSDEAPAALATDLFEAKFTAQRDQGDQRATKKTRTEVENALKAAGVPDAKFSDLPAAIDALKVKAADGLTPDQALAHPAVKQKLNELTASIDQKVTAAKQEERQAFEKERQEFSQKQVAAKKTTLADGLLATLNPVFGDAAKAAFRKSQLIEHLATLPTVEVNGELFEADSQGELKTDALGNPVKYADMVRRETEARYDLPVSTDKSSPGVKQADVASADARPIKTKEEYEQAYIKNQADSAALDKLEADYPEFAKP
jgi:hypothetical protein